MKITYRVRFEDEQRTRSRGLAIAKARAGGQAGTGRRPTTSWWPGTKTHCMLRWRSCWGDASQRCRRALIWLSRKILRPRRRLPEILGRGSPLRARGKSMASGRVASAHGDGLALMTPLPLRGSRPHAFEAGADTPSPNNDNRGAQLQIGDCSENAKRPPPKQGPLR